MKYQINSTKAYTGRMKFQIFLRWALYALVLLLLYSLMSCGAFGLWQPLMIISLAISVAMREREFSSSVFGIFCGFMIDIAMGTLFGFFAVLLMPFCFFASLISRNLIKVNFLNHLIGVSVATLISFLLYYVFFFVIWSFPNTNIILHNILIPSFIATVITAPLMFFLVKLIANKLGMRETPELDDITSEHVDEESGNN